MKPRKKNLHDLRTSLQDLLETVETELDAGDTSNPDVDEHLYLAKSYLDDLDEKVERLERVGGRGSGGVTLAVPITYNRQIQPGSRDEEMKNLRWSIEQLFQDGVYAYIEGRYGAATITIAAVLEGLLKYKLSEEAISYGENCALNCCIDKAEGDIFPASSEILAKAETVRDIRNDVIHLNPERGITQSELAQLRLLDHIEPAAPDDPVTVMDSDGNVTDVPMHEVAPNGAATIDRYRNASIVVITCVKDIRDYLYDDQATG